MIWEQGKVKRMFLNLAAVDRRPQDKAHLNSAIISPEILDQFWTLISLMATDELIDSHVSLKQCRKAVEALHAHENKKEEAQRDTELLPGKEQNIWLNVTVKKVPSSHSFKPVKMSVSKPFILVVERLTSSK